MTSERAAFETRIAGGNGYWPDPPATWGYSPLREAELCPRRWALSRASYPDVWARPGYPQRPQPAALLGDIVHRCLELVLQAMHRAGCHALSEPASVEVLRQLGGYSALAGEVIEERMRSLEGNPRAVALVDALRTNLRSSVPDIRRRVQAVLARTTLIAGNDDKSNGAPGDRGPLPVGSHPEVELRAGELRLTGRADLVTLTPTGCEITDYKTGTQDADHAVQLRTYALLWSLDRDVNPQTLPVHKLTVAYASHDEFVDTPTSEQLADLTSEVAARISAVEDQVATRPPAAHPAPDLCRFCSVRQMCEDYWHAAPSWQADPTHRFADCEGTVISQNGPKSWVLETPSHHRMLLRTPTESPGFSVGTDVRVLGVAIGTDDDTNETIATMTAASEVFALSNV